jgi:hypothetical protein
MGTKVMQCNYTFSCGVEGGQGLSAGRRRPAAQANSCRSGERNSR